MSFFYRFPGDPSVEPLDVDRLLLELFIAYSMVGDLGLGRLLYAPLIGFTEYLAAKIEALPAECPDAASARLIAKTMHGLYV